MWREATAIPDVLAEIVDADAVGESDVVRLLRPARRLVATGNGAAYYAALALWTAALERPGEAPRSSPSRPGCSRPGRSMARRRRAAGVLVQR